jgi:hypothetical protein
LNKEVEMISFHDFLIRENLIVKDNVLNEQIPPDLFSAVTDQQSMKIITDILNQNPDLLPKIEKFKQENPNSFNSSVSNFNSNHVDIRHLQKLADGKSLTWYDWM